MTTLSTRTTDLHWASALTYNLFKLHRSVVKAVCLYRVEDKDEWVVIVTLEGPAMELVQTYLRALLAPKATEEPED